MEYTNVLLIKQKLTKWEYFGAVVRKERKYLDLNHKIYVPNKFILGNFKAKFEGDFKLSENNITYTDSEKDLNRLKEDIENKKFEVVKEIKIPKPTLDILIEQGRQYITSQKQFPETVKNLGQYLN